MHNIKSQQIDVKATPALTSETTTCNCIHEFQAGKNVLYNSDRRCIQMLKFNLYMLSGLNTLSVNPERIIEK